MDMSNSLSLEIVLSLLREIEAKINSTYNANWEKIQQKRKLRKELDDRIKEVYHMIVILNDKIYSQKQSIDTDNSKLNFIEIQRNYYRRQLEKAREENSSIQAESNLLSELHFQLLPLARECHSLVRVAETKLASSKAVTPLIFVEEIFNSYKQRSHYTKINPDVQCELDAIQNIKFKLMSQLVL